MNIVVTGTGDRRGLGHRIATALRKHTTARVCGFTLQPKVNSVQVGCEDYPEYQVDITDFTSVENGLAKLHYQLETHGDPSDPLRVDAIINCAGVNKIAMLEDFSIQDWDLVMNTNARGIFYMAKVFLEDLKITQGTICNIVSNASHMPMTSSLAYNASKGAAHIMTLQMARELTKRHGITVFGISPNKLAGTGMSEDIEKRVCETRGWTPEKAKEYQLASLLAGETDPNELACFVAYLFSSREAHKYLTGCVIPYGA